MVGALARVLAYLAEPKSAGKLAEVYRVWRRDERDDAEAAAETKRVAEGLRRIKHVEDLVAPRLSDWLQETLSAEDQADLRVHLGRFREQVGSWLRAAEMPIDQLTLSIGGDIFRAVSDIATAHMVALHLSRLAEAHPLMRLPDFAAELYEIAENKLRFSGLGD